ncbi:uncharacterized protein PFL1_04352 [Pseudozyma flocculosa PF-1]|uniref:F-box domain-containing protein n=1 Tax=Pseudozyma flocculosa PF-1 TaxID=1277687 RepID=A0A061H7R3_9BASI|nr:uncharacterized protein PFL1_04352 [Pseudozyma flocculosa PF-1]EPQ28025.1 hypothetical protein PFL1_04352 [Pseudozyma flocculosa PF-1]
MVCFQSLPVELHKTFCDFLDRDDLSSLARTNRCLRALYTPAFKTHLRLDGSEELLRFLAHHLSPSHPEAGASDDDKPATPLGYQASRIFERRPQRVSDQCLDDIRHIVLYEPGVVWRGPQEKRVSELFSRIDRHAISENAGGPIGAILALCPNTVTLSVLQTPLAMMPSLAAAVVANTPRLRALTIHSPHVDADALATVVGGLRHLDKLDVSGVKTCGCRGEEGQRAGVHALAAALRRSRSLRRLVLTACKALSTDNGALLALLAQAPGKGQEGRETGSSLRLSSLEIRRSPPRLPPAPASLRRRVQEGPRTTYQATAETIK